MVPPHDAGVFGWFGYVQDFPGGFTLEWLRRLAPPGAVVWEPFSGSGTTLVAGQMLGLPTFGFDLNPFMVEVARAKLDWGLDGARVLALTDAALADYVENVLPEPTDVQLGTWKEYDALATGDGFPIQPKMERWVSPAVLLRLRRMVASLDRIEDTRVRRFARLALASLVVPASNMSFRPNICYKPKPQLDLPLAPQLRARLRTMLADLDEVRGRDVVPAVVTPGDAREAGPARADVVFTSPPYPNDMEYVHQTRLELALLGYLPEKSQLTALKKRMISSSVKLVYRENEWQKAAGLELPGVARVVAPIAKTLEGRDWGWNAADMVAQYFGGMRVVMRNWMARLAPGGVAAVVVGDSAFNGVKVPTDLLTEEAGAAEGFRPEGIEVFRARWNTKHDIELRESVVLLRRP